jgi:hypothetical protein
MTDRIRFIAHEGKQILLVDLSNCFAAEVEQILRALPDVGIDMRVTDSNRVRLPC